MSVREALTFTLNIRLNDIDCKILNIVGGNKFKTLLHFSWMYLTQYS